MPPTPVIAILDVGKTNKKLFLFDESYNIVWEDSAGVPEIKDEDGDPCEDLDLLNSWIREITDQMQERQVIFSNQGNQFFCLWRQLCTISAKTKSRLHPSIII